MPWRPSDRATVTSQCVAVSTVKMRSGGGGGAWRGGCEERAASTRVRLRISGSGYMLGARLPQDLPGQLGTLAPRLDPHPDRALLELGRVQIGILLDESRSDQPSRDGPERASGQSTLERGNERARRDQPERSTEEPGSHQARSGRPEHGPDAPTDLRSVQQLRLVAHGDVLEVLVPFVLQDHRDVLRRI